MPSQFSYTVELIFLLSLLYLFSILIRFQVVPGKPFWNLGLILGFVEAAIGSIAAGYTLGLIFDGATSFADASGGMAFLCGIFTPQIMVAALFISALSEYRFSDAKKALDLKQDPQVDVHAASIVHVYPAPQIGSGNPRAQKGTLILTGEALLCRDIEIPLEDVRQAIITPYKWSPIKSAVLSVETKKKEVFHFGLRDYTPWTRQSALEIAVAQPRFNLRVLFPYLLIASVLLYSIITTLLAIFTG
jgi:hypothetical protein